MHRLGWGCTEMGQYEKNACQNTAHCLNHPPLHPLPSREGKSEGFQHQSLENRPVPVLKTRPLPTLIPEEPEIFPKNNYGVAKASRPQRFHLERETGLEPATFSLGS